MKVNQPGNRGEMEPLSELAPSGKTQFLDLDPKIAAYTTYIPIPPLNLIVGGVWFAMEPNNTFTKFHATQSLIFNGAAFAIVIALNVLTGIMMFIPFIGGFISGILSFVTFLFMLAYLIVAIKCMIDVNKGNPVRLPYISDLAEKYSRGI
jgi:uncharacterized membrane protein